MELKITIPVIRDNMNTNTDNITLDISIFDDIIYLKMSDEKREIAICGDELIQLAKILKTLE